MSNAPYLLAKARFGYRLGHGEVLDSMVYDGLTSTFDGLHMVQQNSQVARELGISRGSKTPGPRAHTSGRPSPRTRAASTMSWSQSVMLSADEGSAATRRSRSLPA